MLRFRSLGSGSSGNATVVESFDGLHHTRLLVDCGLGIRELERRLARASLRFEDLHAIFITHEHADHVGCARAVALKYQLPVWMSGGTYLSINTPDLREWLRTAQDMLCIELGGMCITPFTVPHDAREPLQLHITDGQSKLGILTDLGHGTGHVVQQLANCHALLLEANHEPELLAASSYPTFLKARVAGKLGHLSNQASGDTLKKLKHGDLKHVVAAHLSEKNNRPELAQAALSTALGTGAQDILVATATEGTEWLTV